MGRSGESLRPLSRKDDAGPAETSVVVDWLARHHVWLGYNADGHCASAAAVPLP